MKRMGVKFVVRILVWTVLLLVVWMRMRMVIMIDSRLFYGVLISDEQTLVIVEFVLRLKINQKNIYVGHDVQLLIALFRKQLLLYYYLVN